MYIFDFDPETNGIELSWRDTGGEIPHREARPVYAAELTLLGMKDRWQYPDDDSAPLMWAVNNVFYYKGRKVMKAIGGSCHAAPEITVLEEPEPAGTPLTPCDIALMCAKNRELLDALTAQSIAFVRKVYSDYCDKVDLFYVAFSGGKDSEVQLDLVRQALNPGDYKVVFGDTGMEFPDTYKLVEQISAECAAAGIEFLTSKAPFDPSDSWREFGPPSDVQRWCCSVHKTAPQIQLLRDVAGKAEFTVLAFTGVRHAESARRSHYEPVAKGMKHRGQYNAYPIIDWSSAEVWLYIYTHSLPVNAGYRKGNRRAGCLVCPKAGGVSEWYRDACYPAETARFREIIKDFYSTKCAGDPDKTEFYAERGWKARRNGMDLNLETGYADYYKGGMWHITVSAPHTDWREWIKTIGILRDDKSPYRVLFRGRTYIFEAEETKQGYKIRTAEKDRLFIKLLKECFRRAASCVQCQECAADCLYGCISFTGKSVHISDKCRHCAECHKALDGCIRYHSIVKAKVKETPCCKCGKPVDVNTIGLNKRLLGRSIDCFMCLDCLSGFFHTTREALEAKIEAFRDDGCPLFR